MKKESQFKSSLYELVHMWHDGAGPAAAEDRGATRETNMNISRELRDGTVDMEVEATFGRSTEKRESECIFSDGGERGHPLCAKNNQSVLRTICAKNNQVACVTLL